jgi:anti-anti-sigma factor
MESAVRCHLSPPSALVAIRGDLDVFSAAQVGYRVGDAVRAGCLSIMLDAGETPFVDIAALSELARAAALVRACHGSFDLAAASPSFRRLSTLSGLDVVFRLVAAAPITLSRTPGA